MNWLKGAAATGSGYASKYLQNFSRDKEGSFTVKKPDPASLTHERRGKNSSQEPSFDRSLSDGRFEERMSFSNSVSSDVGDYSDNSNGICEASIFSSPRRGSSLRSRRSNLDRIRPLSSLDSCLMAQLYREHAKMEENMDAPLPSPCTPAFRPFHVTDDTQLVSRSRFDSFNLQVRDGKRKAHDQVSPKVSEAVFGGIPRLPLISSQKSLRLKTLKKTKDEKKTPGNSQRMPNEMKISSQGSPDGTVLFCLGVSVGIISSILANKAEVTKLHDLLKQTENLVQDLQEELVMKDSMIVKELVNEENIFSFLNDNSTDVKKPTKSLLRSDSDVATIHSVEASYTHKSTETIESMSMIEAELEAELERLELNMKKSAPCGCLTDDDELDPDLVAEVVQGELRADMFTRKPSSDNSLDHHSSSVSTPCSQKQAFSPHELSLRLHQVIESRLEQRIMELESSLDKSQKKILQLQSSEQNPSSLTEFSRADVSSSSSSEPSSPMEAHGYNEACMEFKKVNGSENKEHNFEIYTESGGEQNFRSLSMKENVTEDGLFLFRPAVVVPQVSVIDSRLNDESPNFPVGESESEDDDMTQLIKKILEKTKQGPPAILNAHKAMIFLDSNDE